MATGPVLLTLKTAPLADQPLFLAIEALKKACEVFPNIRDLLLHLLFEDGQTFRSGLVECRSLPTTRTCDLLVQFDISDRFREIVAAAVAGEVEKLAVYEICHE